MMILETSFQGIWLHPINSPQENVTRNFSINKINSVTNYLVLTFLKFHMMGKRVCALKPPMEFKINHIFQRTFYKIMKEISQEIPSMQTIILLCPYISKKKWKIALTPSQNKRSHQIYRVNMSNAGQSQPTRAQTTIKIYSRTIFFHSKNTIKYLGVKC